MSLLDEPARAPVRQARGRLGGPVRLMVLSQIRVDPSSEEIGRLVEGVASVRPGPSVESRNLVLGADRSGELAIECVAAIAVPGGSAMLEHVERASRRTGGGLVVP
jgi:hypothetical protein